MARREELLEVECDNAMVHTFLTKFPKNIDLELVISHAHQLYTSYPPETLQNRAESWLDERYVRTNWFIPELICGSISKGRPLTYCYLR